FLYSFFFSSRRRHTRFSRDWSSDVCSSDLFVVDDRINAERAWAGAAWLHRMKRRNGGAEKPAVFRLPPRIDDDRLAFADDFVIRSEERRVGKECRSGWRREY